MNQTKNYTIVEEVPETEPFEPRGFLIPKKDGTAEYVIDDIYTIPEPRRITLNAARELAEALSKIQPTDPARKAEWIHVVHTCREILAAEIPILNTDAWEHLCYPE